MGKKGVRKEKEGKTKKGKKREQKQLVV